MLLYKSSLTKTKTTLRSGQRFQPQGLDRFGKKLETVLFRKTCPVGRETNIENNIVQRFCKRTESLFPGSEPKAERPEEKIAERETSTILK